MFRVKSRSRGGRLWATFCIALVFSLMWTTYRAPQTSSASPPSAAHSQRWAVGPVLDQGSGPTCVGMAWSGLLDAEPSPRTYVDGALIYGQAQERDGLPNTTWGTTDSAAAKYLLEAGLISQWRVAHSWQEAKDWLITRGPVILSGPWHDAMSRPAPDGYAIPTGPVSFNHSYLCYEWTEGGQYGLSFTCQNSWGQRAGAVIEGQGGRFRLHASDVGRLMAEGGYAVLAVKH